MALPQQVRIAHSKFETRLRQVERKQRQGAFTPERLASLEERLYGPRPAR